MRSTVHLVTAADALLLRPWVQPMLDRGLRGSQWATGIAGLDREQLVGYGRQLLAEQAAGPRRVAHRARRAVARRDPASLASALRVWAPLVQVPPRGVWGSAGQPARTRSRRRARLGADTDTDTDTDTAGGVDPAPDLVRRYLAAFGPATPADMQKWCGLTGLKGVFTAHGPAHATRADDGRVLYDLPDAELADPDQEVSARFVADFDNLLLSHADRTRSWPTSHRTRVITSTASSAAPSWSTDSSVASGGSSGPGVRRPWSSSPPSRRLAAADRDALAVQGERLLAAAYGELPSEVRFSSL